MKSRSTGRPRQRDPRQHTAGLVNVRRGIIALVFSASFVQMRTWDQTCYWRLVDFESVTWITQHIGSLRYQKMEQGFCCQCYMYSSFLMNVELAADGFSFYLFLKMSYAVQHGSLFPDNYTWNDVRLSSFSQSLFLKAVLQSVLAANADKIEETLCRIALLLNSALRPVSSQWIWMVEVSHQGLQLMIRCWVYEMSKNQSVFPQRWLDIFYSSSENTTVLSLVAPLASPCGSFGVLLRNLLKEPLKWIRLHRPVKSLQRIFFFYVCILMLIHRWHTWLVGVVQRNQPVYIVSCGEF